jgi:hypothetical protein
MRKLVISGLLLTLVVCAGVAGASPAGTNGQITFARFNPTVGDTQVYVVDPDGSHERLVQGSTVRSATSASRIRACSTRAGSRRPTGRSSSARRSATTAARTGSTSSARRTAAGSGR